MDRMTIRAARPDEYSAVERLMKQVHAMHVQWRPDVFAMPEAVLPEDVFAADAADGMLIVAEKAGQVLAVMQLQLRHVERPGRITEDMLHIDALGVDESCRGQGVGRALIEEAKRIARAKGCTGLTLGVYACNEHAVQMYEHCGFTARSINMEMKLTDGCAKER